MRILLIASSYNGLCQRAHIELGLRGHEVSITLAISDEAMQQAVELFQPDLIICPFLKERVPENIWKNRLCIIIHPGIKGDRGPSSLDWAITDNLPEWGVTALEASEEMDAGDIWATANFKMRNAAKASIYRHEVTRTAAKLILETVEKFLGKSFTPEKLDYSKPDVKGKLRPLMKQPDRKINWETDTVEMIIRKMNAADSFPGVLDTLCGEEFNMFGAHKEDNLRGWKPGEIVAKRHGAICRAAVDGAVWISHLKRKKVENKSFLTRLTSKQKPDFKLPATLVLGDANLKEVPESPIELLYMQKDNTFKEIWYEEENQVGYLHFNFHNGAMSTEQCHRLRLAYVEAKKRSTKVIVLMGGTDFWSNGIHLNMIEAAKNPADESWRNINAIDDMVLEIINSPNHLTISAVYGSAGAGGVIMTLAADKVLARAGVIMNPHYKTMGLYGSEYWTYLLPKRVGVGRAIELTDIPLPIGMQKAKEIGLIDATLPEEWDDYLAELHQYAETLAHSADYAAQLQAKNDLRKKDEAVKPLAAYRAAELKRMKMNFYPGFYGGDHTYHEARYNFVHKIRPKETAAYLAKHLQLNTDNFQELRKPLNY
jgi:putative two-component system hydrogenase maturation factor HypX/HoxX